MSKGLGKVQIKILKYLGSHPISGGTYQYLKSFLSLRPQTLCRALRRLREDQYINAAEEDWFDDGEITVYTLTTKGLIAYVKAVS